MVAGSPGFDVAGPLTSTTSVLLHAIELAHVMIAVAPISWMRPIE
jgi:hypothetical protein